MAMHDNTLKSVHLEMSGNSAVAVVVASEGYPEDTKTGQKLAPIPPQYMSNAFENGTFLFFGAVDSSENGIFTNGGRAATVVGVDKNILLANSRVYKSIDMVSFDGSWYRSDIGVKFFESVTEA